ncbi:hypothetical protein [Pseudoalteromonas sp. SG44-17]|uniref:hypothetical protein n=1 Tax=Pseudoalteromonas sp. SG44-17 TaxID=2760963 RepID=UPI001600671A|nr:hypothetical protein [Pseudoalteromonas sp. SG44-17]MBB1408281.1 hypothetical protein [Pseudoalteromonas sp. SG44-17]
MINVIFVMMAAITSNEVFINKAQNGCPKKENLIEHVYKSETIFNDATQLYVFYPKEFSGLKIESVMFLLNKKDSRLSLYSKIEEYKENNKFVVSAIWFDSNLYSELIANFEYRSNESGNGEVCVLSVDIPFEKLVKNWSGGN